MGELHDAVTALLDAFARGISVIRAQHSRRKEEQLPVDLVQQTAETHVRKSLKKSRADVKEAYTRDLARYGPRFAAGDGTFSPTITAAVSSAHPVKARSGDGAMADVSAAEARSAFSLILLRLNAAFMSIIERFTKGRSTREDYHTLMSLSNASRLEAMRTFEQLSKRLPQSALSLTPQTKSSERHTHSSQKRRSKQIPSVKSGRNRRSQSAPPVLKTKASDNPRPRRTHKKPSGNSKSSTISKTPRSTEDKHRSTPSPTLPVIPRQLLQTPKAHARAHGLNGDTGRGPLGRTARNSERSQNTSGPCLEMMIAAYV
ncbi:hypothetical protein OIDMADRAFT_176179 [Oidiodendron maius Zn]|uniref:Uncharacterized protein n=1 Tax=Oidiodendron maius (strain Zn) TaxID=913774 RepID=A0A0C3DVD6_OIDMZ|nr:hypothetical protein OIDMADRAFT_176179 [Oidiodendron maius Zn]